MPLDAEQRSEALLGRGYFPKELPPPFHTRTFADSAIRLRSQWASLYASMSRKARDNHPLPSHPVLFDMARKGHARRTLAMPNPINQFYLVEEISRYWTNISNIIDSSSISLTKCDIAEDGRAIPMPPLSSLGDKRVILYASQGAILQTDVLSFYHSIYTHAIPWALHGKAIAKANRSARDPAMFGNRIDALVRACQDGQTIGVPVGPDTSRVISELMLCAVESKIPPKTRRLISEGFRYIDDFFLCFDSLSDAEVTLAAIRESCLHFDLQLNASKTQIIPVAAFNEETWPSEVSAIRIASNGKPQRQSLMRFFSTAIQLSKELPNESIANFAVRKTTKVMIDIENWDLYEAFLLRMARENSNCMDSIVKIICTYASIGYPISSSVNRFIERIISDHAPYNQHFEVSWVLWLARSLDIRLSTGSSALVMRMENDVCAMLALHLRGRRLLSGRSQLPAWLGPVTSNDLYGSHWLLIYEAATRTGWNLSGAATAVASNPFFTTMLNENISFYDNRSYNRPLKLPGIESKLRQILIDRNRVLLPGAVLAIKRDFYDDTYYEELGADYENDDDFRSFHDYDDDEI